MSADGRRDQLASALMAFFEDEAEASLADVPEATEMASAYADALLPTVEAMIADAERVAAAQALAVAANAIAGICDPCHGCDGTGTFPTPDPSGPCLTCSDPTEAAS